MKPFFLIAGILIALPILIQAQSQGKVPVTIMSCTELECIHQKDVFFAGEGAYIDYNSTIKGISYAATLTHPDGTRQQIAFPNRITSNVTGNYTIDMTVWKEGYDETQASKIVQFVEVRENPPVLDWIPLAAVAGIAVVVFAAWRLSGRKKKK